MNRKKICLSGIILAIGIAAQLIFPIWKIIKIERLYASGEKYFVEFELEEAALYRGNWIFIRHSGDVNGRVRDKNGEVVTDRSIIDKVYNAKEYVCDDRYDKDPVISGNSLNRWSRSPAVKAEAVVYLCGQGAVLKDLLIDGKPAYQYIRERKNRPEIPTVDLLQDLHIAVFVSGQDVIFNPLDPKNMLGQTVAADMAGRKYGAVILPFKEGDVSSVVYGKLGLSDLGVKIKTGRERGVFHTFSGRMLTDFSDSWRTSDGLHPIFPLFPDIKFSDDVSAEERLEGYVKFVCEVVPWSYGKDCQVLMFYGNYPLLSPEKVLETLKKSVEKHLSRKVCEDIRKEIIWFLPVEKGAVPEGLDPESVILVCREDPQVEGMRWCGIGPGREIPNGALATITEYDPFSFPPVGDNPEEKISKALRQYKKSTEQKDAENVLSLMASAVQASDPELSDPEKRRLFRLCLDGISKRHMRTFFDEKFLDYDDYTEFVRWAKEEYGEIVPLGGFPEDTVNPLRPPEVRQYTREEMEKLADEFCAAMSFSL